MMRYNILKSITLGVLTVLICSGMVLASGETVNVSIGTLPAGKSITIIYDVTVNDPLPQGIISVSQQGTVSGSNFSSVATDDPKTILVPLDPTVTQLGNELPVAGFGKALGFNGTDQYVVISDAGALTSASYTVEAWVKFNTIQSTAIIQRLNAAETISAFGLYLNSSGNFVHYADDGALRTDTGTTIAEVGKWYHVAGVFSAGTMRLFVDGVEEGTPVSGIGSLTGSMDHFDIGKGLSGRGDNYLNGQIDEIRLWNAALSESGIADWMYRGIDTSHLNYSSLAAYYKLDDGTGNTAEDSVAAFDGTLQNMANANWVDSIVNEWYTDEDVAFGGKLVGSDADGASTNGTDWALTFELVTDGTKGHVVIGADNNFIYTPNANDNGDDAFTYRVKDAIPADSNVFTVTVHIESVPDVPLISKAFGAPSIPLDGSTTLTFNLSNSDPNTPLTGIGFSDTLPAGLVISTPNGLTGKCGGGTITADQGTNVISISGTTFAAGGSCTFSVNVTGTTAGTKNNTTSIVTSNESAPGSTASASIFVVAPPVITKAFGASSIQLNGSTSLTFTITNPAANELALTGLAFTDLLPAGLAVATPNGLTNTCGGTATAVAGSGSVSLTGGTIAVSSSCSIAVNVTGTASGNYTNVTGNVTSTNGGTGNTGTANISVATPPTITKAFGATSIPLNGSTSLTFTITNPAANTIPLTGLAFTDNLPAGLEVSIPNGLSNSCGGTATAIAGAFSVSLSGGTLASSASCTITVNIAGIIAGVKNNSVQVLSTEGGTGNTSNASITVVAPPAILKAFGASSIPLSGSTSLSFTIQNNNTTTTLTGIAFTDNLPAGLVVSTPSVVSGSCGGGTITAIAGTNFISMTGAALAQGSSCTFSVNVTGTTAGTKNNTTGNVTSNQGGTGGTASASINVVAPPVIAKAFGAASIPLNNSTSLTFTITNPATNAVAETGVAFSDTLPAGMVVATPNGLSGSCGGGTVMAVAGSGSLSLTGGTIAVNSSCTLVVNVTGTAAGAKNNITGNVSSTNGGTGNTATANLAVATPPVIAKAFGAATIPLNGSTSLTFTINNLAANTIPLTGIAFTDNLPAGLVVSTPSNLNNTCGGTVTAVDGSSSVSLTGATLAVNTSCTLSVNITGTTAGVKNNSVQVNSNEGGTGNTSNASITVVAPPVIAKAFGAGKILLNGSTPLSFTIQNANNVTALAGVGFTDTLPAGLVVSTPNGLSGSCGGTITATDGSGSINLSGSTLAALASCTFSVNVTGTTVGLKDNSVTVTSTNGGTGNTSNASVTVVGPPIATAATDITKISFSANWNASEGATGYRLDVATDSGFIGFVAGFNNLDVGNVTTYSVASGLVSGKTYYYRVRAYFPGSTTESSNTVKLTTLGGKMSRNSWYLSPEGWIVRAYTKADAPNEVYLEVLDTGNNLVNPSVIAGMTTNPKLIASDAAASEVALGFNKATRTAHVTYTSAGGRQVVTVTGVRQAP